MPADDFFRLNNRVYSNKSIIIAIAAVPYAGIVSADYEDGLETEIVHGANRDGAPLGQTAGKYTASPVTIGMLADVFRKKFLTQLAALNVVAGAPGSLGMAAFDVSIQYSEFPLPPDLDVISGCRFLKAKDTYAEGPGAMVTEITLQPMTISRNGLTIFDRTRSIP